MDSIVFSTSKPNAALEAEVAEKGFGKMATVKANLCLSHRMMCLLPLLPLDFSKLAIVLHAAHTLPPGLTG